MAILLAVLLPIGVWAQTETADSLLRLFDAQQAAGRQSDVQQSVQIANRLFAIFEAEELTPPNLRMTAKTPADTVRQQVWYWAAEYYNQHQQYKQASEYGQKALPLFESGRNRSGEGDCLAILAISFIRQGDFSQAVSYAKRCNELDRKRGDASCIASSLNLLAAIFTTSYQHKEAERCILEGLQYAEEARDSGRIAILNGMACENYNYQKDYTRSLHYGRKALAIEQQLGREHKIAMRQSQIAGALIGLGRMSEARRMLEEALPALRDNNKHSYAIACNQMGDILLSEQQYARAAACFNDALQLLTAQGDAYNETHSRLGLYKALRHSNPSQAMEHIDRYITLHDSIYDQRTATLTANYAALMGYQRLQAEKDELLRQRLRIVIIAIAAFLLAVAALWCFAHFSIVRERRRIAQLTQQIKSLPKEAPATGSQDFLRRLTDVVNEQLAQGQLGVEQVAEQMNMSSTKLRRQLLQATGESPKAYFTAIQMDKATRLLTTTDTPIADIALKCGYQEMTSFIRAFKRIHGVSPSQYAKR